MNDILTAEIQNIIFLFEVSLHLYFFRVPGVFNARLNQAPGATLLRLVRHVLAVSENTALPLTTGVPQELMSHIYLH